MGVAVHHYKWGAGLGPYFAYFWCDGPWPGPGGVSLGWGLGGKASLGSEGLLNPEEVEACRGGITVLTIISS